MVPLLSLRCLCSRRRCGQRNREWITAQHHQGYQRADRLLRVQVDPEDLRHVLDEPGRPRSSGPWAAIEARSAFMVTRVERQHVLHRRYFRRGFATQRSQR